MSEDSEKVAKAQKLFARLSPVLSSSTPLASSSSSSACPVSPQAMEAFNPKTGLPADLEKDSSKLSSTSLGISRQQSSIPMADYVPKHQEDNGSGTWLYPSEFMFYSAMKRKGWDPREDDMKAVVSIHNSVNERAWKEVLVWESMHSSECAMPRLKKFMGRQVIVVIVDSPSHSCS